MLGDDGLLLTSRNGVAEPLYGLAATTQIVLSRARRQADARRSYSNRRAAQGGRPRAVLRRQQRHHLRRPRQRLRSTAAPATTRCRAPRRWRSTTTGATRSRAGRARGVLRGRQRAPARLPPGAARGVPLLQRERPVAQDHDRDRASTSCSTSRARARRADAGSTTARTCSSATPATTGSSAARTTTACAAATATTCSRPTTTSTRPPAPPTRSANDIPDTPRDGTGLRRHRLRRRRPRRADRQHRVRPVDTTGPASSTASSSPFNPFGEPTVSRLISPGHRAVPVRPVAVRRRRPDAARRRRHGTASRSARSAWSPAVRRGLGRPAGQPARPAARRPPEQARRHFHRERRRADAPALHRAAARPRPSWPLGGDDRLFR